MSQHSEIDQDERASSMMTGANIDEATQVLTQQERRRNISSVIVLFVVGMLVGIQIGLFSPLLIFYNSSIASSPCRDAVDAGGCTWLGGSTSSCQWNAHRQACVTDGPGQLCVLYGRNSSICNALTSAAELATGQIKNVSCKWRARPTSWQGGVCVDMAKAPKAAAWSSAEEGLIASMMIAGGFLSSFSARKYVVDAQQILRALQLSGGGFGILSAAFFMGGWATPMSFAARLGLITTGRFVSGLLLGSASVFATIFNALNSRSRVMENAAVFQIATASGIAVAALVGLAAKRKDDGAEPIDSAMLQRLQAVFAVSAACAVPLLLLPCFVTVRGTPNDTKQDGEEEETIDSNDAKHDDDNNDDDDRRRTEIVSAVAQEEHAQHQQPSFQNPIDDSAARASAASVSSETHHLTDAEQERAPLTPLSKKYERGAVAAGGWAAWRVFFREPKFAVAAAALAGAQVFSGINVTMSFSGTILHNSGGGIGDQLAGNAVIMFFNFAVSVLAFPLTRKARAKGIDSKRIYIYGAAAAAGCNLLTGVVSFPGVVADKSAMHGLSMTAMALFFCVFQLTMGPQFYGVLSTSFPARAMKSASVFCLAVHWMLTFVLLMCFPLMIDSFGGAETSATATDEQKQRGFAASFLLFGAINLASAIVLRILLPKLKLGEDEQQD